MFKLFIILFFVIFFTNTNANNKDKILENLKNTKNLNFQFEQNINNKIEKGNCTIEYPKKIFCEYSKNKILVSNGKSLVIKTRSSYYLYPLKKTLLNLILDKNFLMQKISSSEERIIENNYINFNISDNDNEINIFFDNETFNLIGWQTNDIYQNLNITFIYSVKINQKINQKNFELPKNNQ